MTQPRSRRRCRRGVSLVVIVSLMVVFAVMAAIMIDYAYMQQIRTEMRTMTDAAAKAGAEALARTENVEEARAAAIRYAQLNPVANQPFQLDDEDIQIGRLAFNGSSRWEFQEDRSPFNAVRVLARTGDGASQAAFPLFFGSLLGKEAFAPSYQATAGQQSVEVCLCLDRSGSMLFDMSGVDYSYPPNNPNLVNFRRWGTTWRYHLSPPHPVDSRWAVLARAIDLFMDEAGAYSPPPRTALVTWSFELHDAGAAENRVLRRHHRRPVAADASASLGYQPAGNHFGSRPVG